MSQTQPLDVVEEESPLELRLSWRGDDVEVSAGQPGGVMTVAIALEREESVFIGQRKDCDVVIKTTGAPIGGDQCYRVFRQQSGGCVVVHLGHQGRARIGSVAITAIQNHVPLNIGDELEVQDTAGAPVARFVLGTPAD